MFRFAHNKFVELEFSLFSSLFCFVGFYLGLPEWVFIFFLHFALFIASTALRPMVFMSVLQASFHRSLVVLILE